MANIKAFNGILYNRKKVNITKVVAPPYDVISESMQSKFYSKDDHNVIRLILGKEEKSDGKSNNKYTRAKNFLNDWLRRKVLVKDSKHSIYVHLQEYLHKGKKKTRIGFIALMKIEDPKRSGILPHEYTLSKPKEDRMKLIKSAKTNLSPIFSLFQDKNRGVNNILRNTIKSGNPLFSVETEGVIHKLWCLSDKKAIKRVIALMKDKKIFIADGHHRYEVALNYRNAMRKTKAFKNSMDYVMMYFSDLKEKSNLTVFPTHRVLKNVGRFNGAKLQKEFGKHFNITVAPDLERCMDKLEKAPLRTQTFGVYVGNGKFYNMAPKKGLSIYSLIKKKKTKALKRLDVTVLHDLIIDNMFDPENKEGSLKYIRDEKDAVKVVDNGDYEIAFFLRPTDVMDMKAVAEKGEMMPQKSTYFYPKLLTGLVMNKF